MLWQKKKGPLAEPAPQVLETEEAAGKALEVMCSLLTLYGQFAFDTDSAEAAQTRADCADWAQRIALGEAKAAPEQGPTQEPRGAAARRDWPGLLSFMHERRKHESDYVTRSMTSFREMILCFAACMSQTVANERDSEQLVTERMDALAEALASRDLASIEARALGLTDSIKSAVAARRQRETEQLTKLRERVAEVRDELSMAQRKTETDPLTQLASRAAFDERLLRLASLGVLLERCPHLVLLDLDHFKAVNDKHGHPAGDHVLVEVSRYLNRTFLRRQDLVCRYGGAEFAVLLLDATEEQTGMLVERLLSSVRGASIEFGLAKLRVTASAGSAGLAAGEAAMSWLTRANKALSAAKSKGRDRHVRA